MSGKAEKYWPVVGTGPACSGVRAQEVKTAVWMVPKQPLELLKVGSF